MPRPHVQIAAPNQRDRLRAHLNTLLPRFASLPGVKGILLNGGLARGFADDHSEIDLTIYLDSMTFTIWQGGAAPIPTGIAVLNGMLYDIKLADIAAEWVRVWEQVELWDLSYAEILYDPDGSLERLKEEKLLPVDAATAGGPLFACWWHFRLAGDIWVQRQDTLQGHLVLNNAVVELLKALYIANGEYIPHDKWLVHLSRTLNWQPDNWTARLAQAMTAAPVLSSLQTRQQVIARLWEEIDLYLIRTYFPHHPLNMMHMYFYDRLAELVTRGRIPIDDWKAAASMSLLNEEPFYSITTVTDEHVVLDRARFLSLEPREMYSWHYAIVNALRGDTL